MSWTESETCVGIDHIRSTKQATVNGGSPTVNGVEEPNFTAFDNKSAEECASESDSSLPIVNCVPVLEFAKSNIVALIDDHIALMREKEQSMKLINDERIKRMKSATMQKSIERRNHIERMRNEFDATINRFKHLLDELEKIQ